MKTIFTQKEFDFIKLHLHWNSCGAKTARELLEDNHSCQEMEEMMKS